MLDWNAEYRNSDRKYNIDNQGTFLCPTIKKVSQI